MMRQALAFFLSFSAILAQPPSPPAKLRVRVGAVQTSARSIEFVPGSHIVLSPSCSGSVCTITVNASPVADPNTVDYSGASKTILARTGAALPASCSQGEWFFLTSAQPGRNVHVCAPANTWRQIGADGADIGWSDLIGNPEDNPSLASLLAAKANAAHFHSAGDITSGVLAPARLGSGQAGGSTFLRGNQVWSEVSWDDITGKPVQFPSLPHGHPISDVAGLQAALDGKAEADHAHDASDIAAGVLAPSRLGAGLPTPGTYLRGDGVWSTVAWSALSGVPAEFPPSPHGHAASEISGLSALLEQKAEAGHTHDAQDTVSGVFPPVRLGSGPASASAYLRGDGMWSAVDWAHLSGVPSAFPPAAHSHAAADVAGLETALSGKADAVHSHAAGDVVSGVFSPARLGSGSPSAGNFLRGDGVWSPVDWSDVQNKPDFSSQVAPHTHPAADIQPSGALPGQVLKWNGSAWAPASDQSGIPEPPSAQAGQFLRYDGSSWGASAVSWSDLAGVPAQFAPSAHAHPVSDIAGLQEALDAKAPAAHTHAASDIASGVFAPQRLGSGAPDASFVLHGDGQWRAASWNNLSGRPASFPPEAHAHEISDVNMLQAALDGKAPLSHQHSAAQISSGVLDPQRLGTGWQNDASLFLSAEGKWARVSFVELEDLPISYPPAPHAHAISEVTGLETALSGKAPLSHTHSGADIVSGSIPANRLGSNWSGPGSEFFLAADNTWRLVSFSDLDGIPAVFPPEAHTHALSDLRQDGAQTGQLLKWSGSAWTPGQAHWGEIAGVPSQFPPAAHEHAIAEISGLDAALSGKSPLVHTHDAGAITSGRLAPERLGDGWENSQALFLSADQAWRRVSFTELDDLPVSFPPSAHTHPASQIQQSGAQAGQALVWNGSSWAPATLNYLSQPPSALPGMALVYSAGAWQAGYVSYGSLADLPTTFPPEAHMHAISDISGLQGALNGKANSSHTHSGADIASGVVAPARLGSNWTSSNPDIYLAADGQFRQVDWNSLASRPAEFPPTPHTHSPAELDPGNATAGQVLTWDGTKWVADDPPQGPWQTAGQTIYYSPAAGGYVGIGTSTPQARLHVQDSSNLLSMRYVAAGVSGSSTVEFNAEVNTSQGSFGGVFYRGRNLWGPASNPGYIVANTRIATFSAEAYTGPNTMREVGAVVFGTQQAWTSTTAPTMMQIMLVPRNTNVPASRIRFEGDGALVLSPADTPAIPIINSGEAKIYVRSNRLVIQFNDAGTIRYKSLLLTGTGTTWSHSTTAP